MKWRLRPDYRENLSRRTWEAGNAGTYWNPQRMGLSADYQFDVYVRARALAVQHGLVSVLDVGSGPGMKAARLFCGAINRVVLLDQPTVSGLVRENCPTAEFVGANLELPPSHLGSMFDLIVCADVIEHLIDPGPCLEFIRAHAAAHTWIIFSTPERDYRRGIKCTVCDKPEHVREWTGEEFRTMLRDFGFNVVRHSLCPTLRPTEMRGDMNLSCMEPFGVRCDTPDAIEPDLMRSCQVCECQVATEGINTE